MLARALVRYAANGLARGGPAWLQLMERELERIASDVEGLIWAIDCVWAIRMERFLSKTPPPLNCALLFVGLYLTIHYLLTHLAWYGLPPRRFEFLDDSLRGFLKLAIFIGLVGLVAVATPGSPRRRVFAALAFPFLGLLGILATAFGLQIVNGLTLLEGNPAVAIIMRGLIFGLIVAALLSLPSVLLYRARAASIAALALVPAIAKTTWTMGQPHQSLHAYASLFAHIWPFICSLIIIAIFTRVCHRWLNRPSGTSGNSSTQ
ncbi:MAG: hypothetical protein JWM63_4989 [Gammaproteobacteria bacterium]|nr:hypothetical protein [Gammaproteobacteria bacterium]